MFNCLIVGCGRIAGSLDSPNVSEAGVIKSHSSCFDFHKKLKIIGYVDTDLEAAKALASKY